MKIKTFHNSWIAKLLLGSRFNTVMLFGSVFTKLGSLSEKTRLHEETHAEQWLDCVVLGLLLDIAIYLALAILGLSSPWFGLLLVFPFFLFYILYGLEWLYLMISEKRTAFDAYIHLSFEKQARERAKSWNLPEQSKYRSFAWWSLK